MPIEKSAEIHELAAALAKAQGVIKYAAKDSFNPHFKTKYADLSSVIDAAKEALAANGLSVSQMPEALEGRVFVTTMLMHSSGQWLSSTLMLTPDRSNPQGIGSAITYGRRYGLSAILGIAQDDDDAESAVDHTKKDHQQRSAQARTPYKEAAGSWPPAEVNPEDDIPYTATDAQKRVLMAWAAKWQVHDRGELAAISQRLLDGGAAMYELEEAIPKIIEKIRAEANGT